MLVVVSSCRNLLEVVVVLGVAKLVVVIAVAGGSGSISSSSCGINSSSVTCGNDIGGVGAGACVGKHQVVRYGGAVWRLRCGVGIMW